MICGRTSWRFLVSIALDENVQSLAILNASVDLEEHFIKMPPIARPRRSASQVVGISLPEVEVPFSDGFVGVGDAVASLTFHRRRESSGQRESMTRRNEFKEIQRLYLAIPIDIFPAAARPVTPLRIEHAPEAEAVEC